MIKEEMNVHKALAELKVLNNRITNKIVDTKFCVANKATNSKIGGKSIENWMNDVRGNYQSINDLINRRNAIKRAVNLSNASNTVNINGKTYSVAEAIEMKQYGIELYETLLREMKHDFTKANNEVANNNEVTEAKAMEYAKQCMDKEKTTVEGLREVENLRSSYYEKHKTELIDPIDISTQIRELEAYIDKFSSEVDSAISVSNATTVITIEY